MTDCYFEKKDWRACASEVSYMSLLLPLYNFRDSSRGS